MLKKIILASALLSSSIGMAVASSAPYVGAGLGITVNTPSSNNVPSYRGMPVNVFAGYGGMMNETFYLAGELGATLGTGQLSDSSPLKTTYGYSASVLPGIMLSDHTLAFVRAGVVRTRFSNISLESATAAYDGAQTKTGGEIGLGLQTSLMQNIDARLEYDYIAYQSIKEADMKVSPRSDVVNLSVVYKFD